MTAPSLPLAETIRIVRAEIAEATAGLGSYADDPENYHRRQRAAMAALAARLAEKVAARITDSYAGTRVRIAGITASSTIGLSGAVTNWLAAAGKRQAQPGGSGEAHV